MEPDNRIWYAVWNMELKNDPGTIVGDFCFKRIGKDGVVEIGYGLKEPYRYHGYMSETVKAITEWVLLQDNVRIVEAETDVNNIASQQVLMRAGFIKNGKIGEEGSRFVYGGEKGMSDKIYPRTSDKQTVYLKNVVTNANIEKGVWIFTLLSDCRQSPRLFAGDFSVLKRLKVSIFKTFQSLFGIIKVSKKAVLFYDDTRNRKSKKANADGMY